MISAEIIHPAKMDKVSKTLNIRAGIAAVAKKAAKVVKVAGATRNNKAVVKVIKATEAVNKYICSCFINNL
jgi:hypothetical protein